MALCSLDNSQYMALVGSVYKRLQATAGGPNTLNVKAIAKDIYNLILKGTNDEAKALGMAQNVPSVVKLIVDTYPKIKTELKPKGLSLDALDDLIDNFALSLDVVKEAVSDNTKAELSKEITIANNMSATKTPVAKKVDKDVSINQEIEAFLAKPLNFNTTTGNQTEDRDFQYTVLQRLVGALKKTELGDASNLRYGNHTGFRLRTVRRDNGLALIVTNKEGDIITFDDQYNVSPDNTGKEVYFFLRITSVKEDEAFIKDVVNRAALKLSKKAATPEEAEAAIKAFEKGFRERRAEERAKTEALIKAFTENPEGKHLVEINSTDSSQGYRAPGKTPLSRIKISPTEKESMRTTYNETTGQFFIKVDNTDNLVLVRPSVELRESAPAILDHIAEVIVTPLQIKDPNTGVIKDVTAAEKASYIGKYINLKKNKNIFLESKDNKLLLEINGVVYDTQTATKEEVANALKSIRREGVPGKQTGGLYLNIDAASMKDNTIPTWSIKENVVTPINRNYLDFLSPYLIANTEPSVRGDLKLLNGHLAWSPLVTEMPTLPQEDKTKVDKALEDKDDMFTPFTRSRALENLMTANQEKAAKKWWATHPLSKVVPLEVMTNVVNSNAWATWSLSGITLYAGSSFTDVYHEAWHAFSQLMLTVDEKKAIYENLRKVKGSFTLPDGSKVDFSKATYKQLEEYTAESFRTYAKNQAAKAPKHSFFKKIFDKIWNILKAVFGKTTPAEVLTQPDQYNGLSEIFNKLYVGDVNNYKPQISNMMFGEANYGITELENPEQMLSFTESKLVNDSIDGILSDYINIMSAGKVINGVFRGGYGADQTFKALSSVSNATKAYAYVKAQIDKKLVEKTAEYENKKDTVDANIADGMLNDIKLLEFVSNNFGDPKKVLLKEQKHGVIAFHRENSNFYKFFQEELKADEEVDLDNVSEEYLHSTARGGFDRSSAVDAEKEAHGFTKYLVDSLIDVDQDGNIKTNRLGFPQIADPGKTWNNLIVNVTGSTSLPELYSRLKELSEKGFPIYKQILDKMGNITRDPNTVSEVEYKMWMMLLQDMNKARLPMYATTFDKTVITGEIAIRRSGSNKGTVVKKDGDVIIQLPDGTEIIPESNVLSSLKEGQSVTLKAAIPADLERLGVEEGDFIVEEPALGEFIGTLSSNVEIVAKVGRTAADTTKLRNNWSSEFRNRSSRNNPYISKDSKNNNILNLKAIAKDFLKAEGEKYILKDPTKALQFLSAIGIYMTDNVKIREYLDDYTTYQKINYLADAIGVANNANLSVTDPIKDLFLKGFKGEREIDGEKKPVYVENSSSRVNELASVEIEYSGEYSALTRSMPGGKTGYEENLNSTMTLIIDALNKAKNIKELYAKGGLFEYMSYLDPKRNPWTMHSVLLNSIFALDKDPLDKDWGQRRADAKINMLNLVGAQILEPGGEESGLGLTDMGYLDKLINDVNSLLLSGVIENPRPGSKSSSFGTHIKNIHVKNAFRKQKYLYIDTFNFTERHYDQAVNEAYSIMSGYLDAEMQRISRIKKQNDIYSKIKNFERGTNFTIFNDILEPTTKSALLEYTSLKDAFNENPQLQQLVKDELKAYFDKRVNRIKDLYFDKHPGVILKQVYENMLVNSGQNFTQEEITKFLKDPKSLERLKTAAIRSFVYNSTIHNIETHVLFFGDAFQYNHNKDEEHKRLSMWQSTGNVFATDQIAINYVNKYRTREYAALNNGMLRSFDGTFNTAIIEDVKPESVYLTMLEKLFTKDALAKNPDMTQEELNTYLYGKGGSKDNPKGGLIKPYSKGELNEADGQAWISIDSYRILKSLEGEWTSVQEDVYQKVIKNISISAKELIETFPVYKLQHTGSLALTENMPEDLLPVMGGHKFSLFPLIPTVIANTPLESLHNQMVKKGMDYVLVESGSKMSAFTSNTKKDPDKAFDGDSSSNILEDIQFTNNRIYVKYLKNQLALHSSFKEKATFATQVRGLLSAGLIKEGVPVDYKGTAAEWDSLTEEQKFNESTFYKKIKRFENSVDKYIQVSKAKIAKQVGWSLDEKGNLLKGDPKLMIEFIKRELVSQDFPKHEIDEIYEDLSLHPSAPRIERILLSIINTRLIRQKIRGEALVEVSVAFTENADAYRFRLTQAEQEKYGTTGLRYYIADGETNTKSCQIKIALSGSFTNLFNALDLEGNPIGIYDTIEKVDENGKKTRSRELNPTKSLANLNKIIKNEEWLNTGNNRKLITLTGVRIPVQGLNSMEFAEVAEFLPPEAGPIIILPSEIVAKSGTDFDVDKLTAYAPYISKKGEWFSDEDFTEEAIQKIIDEAENEKKIFLEAYLNKKGDIKQLEKELIAKSKTSKEALDMVFDLKKDKQEQYESLVKDLKKALIEASEIRALPKALADIFKAESDKGLVKTVRGINEAGMLNDISPTATLLLMEIEDLNLATFDTVEVPVAENLTEKRETSSAVGHLRSINDRLSKAKEYKAARLESIQNTMIDSMQDILRDPYNAVSLLKPNDTHIVKPISTILEPKVQEYNPKQSLLKNGTTLEKGIPSTRVFEWEFNLKKHQDNIISKASLGIAAIDNKYNPIFNNSGAYLEPEIIVPLNNGEEDTVPVNFRLSVNYYRGDKSRVSLSAILDSNNEHEIADVYSQLMNGMVDAEKDAWVAFIQGNKETTPVLLFLIKAGVPVKEAIYFVSNPLTRDYVQAQKVYKGALTELVTGRKNNPAYAKSNAKRDIWKKAGFKGKTPKAPSSLAKLVTQLVGDTNFTLDVTQDIVHNNDRSSNTARAMFLQFLYLESIATATYDKIKRATNVDTSRQSTLIDVEMRNLIVNELRNNKALPEDVVKYFLEKSVLKGFFVQDFANALFGDSFKVRNNKDLVSFLISKLSDFAARTYVTETTGYDMERYAAEFSNNLMVYIFTNYVKKFNPLRNSSYKGITATSEIPTQFVEGLKEGVFVKEVNGKPTMFINNRVLQVDFDQQNYAMFSTSKDSYFNRNLAPVENAVFGKSATDREAYYSFVAEREYLRYNHPIAEFKNTLEFKNRLANLKTSNQLPKASTETVEEYEKRLERMSYETWLRDKALDNTLNFNHLFNSKENSYAKRVMNMIEQQFPYLKDKYAILNQFDARAVIDKQGRWSSTVNLALKDGKKLKPEAASQYNLDLKDLMDPSVKKVQGEKPEDLEKNRMISDLFQLLPYYVFMQGGLSKSEYGYLSIMPVRNLSMLMEEASKQFLTGDLPAKIETYYELFNEKHSTVNRPVRNRATDWSYTKSSRLSAENLEESSLIYKTSKDGIYMFAQKPEDMDNGMYLQILNELVANSPNTVFVINDYFDTSRKGLIANSLGIRTAKAPKTPYVLTPESKADIQAVIDADIQNILDKYNAGYKIVFAESGYLSEYAGQTAEPVDPLSKEFFVYLSKKLLELGYVNPGSERTPSILEILATKQPITQEDIDNAKKEC